MIIDAYSFGVIVVEGKEYRSDIVIFPERIKSNWWRAEGHSLVGEDVEDIVEEQPEVLVVGTGYYGALEIPAETETYITSCGIKVIAGRTQEAIKRYNQLVREGRKVVAAFHLFC